MARQESRYFRVFMLDDLFPSEDRWKSEELRSELWSKLPQELGIKVLLRLPAASQARFQAVSKAWKRLLSSRKFKKESAAVAFSSGLYICGFAHRDAFMTECPYMKRLHVRYKVHKLSLATLPKHLRTSPVEDCYSGRRYAMYNGYFEKMTTGFCDRSDCQGLILLKYLKDCDRSFGSEKSCLCVEIVILNPLNSTWRLLPPLYTPRDVHPEARLTVDGADVNVSVRYETYSEKYKYPDDHRRERLPDSKKTGDFTWVYSSVCNQWMNCVASRSQPSVDYFACVQGGRA